MLFLLKLLLDLSNISETDYKFFEYPESMSVFLEITVTDCIK